MFRSLDCAFIDKGENREQQEGYSYIQGNNLFAVFDGVGAGFLGKEAEQRANRIITESFFNHLSECNSPSEAIIFSLEQANKAILEQRIFTGEKMAVSVSIIYFHDKIMFFSHLGDTRIYSFQDGELSQLTRDHTLREEDPFAEKRFTDPRALQALTQGLGIHDEPDIEVKKYPIDKRGLILLTTEALTERISNREIQWLLEKLKNPGKICKSLIDLSRRKGGDGKLTMGVVKHGLLEKWMKNVLIIYVLFFVILTFFAGSYFLKYKKDEIPEPQKRVKVTTEGRKVSKPIITSEQTKKTDTPPVRTAGTREPIIVDDPVKRPIDTQEPVKVSNADLYDRIYMFVNEWRSAWENTAGRNQKIDEYISFYSGDFKTDGFNRNSWKLDKAGKGRKKQWIKINIFDIRISGPDESGSIEVRFRQDYRSSNYSGISGKIIRIKKEESGWKIFQERSF